MIVSDIPIRLIDVGGAIMMIVLSFLCLNDVRRLKQQDPTSIMWEFLMWICYGFALFAISRSVGVRPSSVGDSTRAVLTCRGV